MTTKERLHLLVDALSETEAAELLHYAEEHTGGTYVCPLCGKSEHVPNEETERALREADTGVGITRSRDASELFEKLGI